MRGPQPPRRGRSDVPLGAHRSAGRQHRPRAVDHHEASSSTTRSAAPAILSTPDLGVTLNASLIDDVARTNGAKSQDLSVKDYYFSMISCRPPA
jgi:hypothetical protein